MHISIQFRERHSGDEPRLLKKQCGYVVVFVIVRQSQLG